MVSPRVDDAYFCPVNNLFFSIGLPCSHGSNSVDFQLLKHWFNWLIWFPQLMPFPIIFSVVVWIMPYALYIYWKELQRKKAVTKPCVPNADLSWYFLEWLVQWNTMQYGWNLECFSLCDIPLVFVVRKHLLDIIEIFFTIQWVIWWLWGSVQVFASLSAYRAGYRWCLSGGKFRGFFNKCMLYG